MTARHTLDLRLFEMLAASSLTAAESDLAVDLCEEVVAMMPDLDVSHRGRAARCAAQLMLDESVPSLDRALRDDLARLCELAVVRGL
ncbi:hypothetical protein [Nocardioides pelophilus]|uniref:hypothetical protein n=1 Tax=Nocardioides pelophilus TaxID=2172019 RepID=UPI0016037DDE|nr:hypothetical protein [Nocardioides pelophilus]